MARKFLETAGITDAGSVRQYNEDNIAFDPDSGIVVLADGMGGHRAGEVASRMTVQLIVRGLQAQVENLGAGEDHAAPLQLVDQCINAANEAVFDAAQVHSNYQGMGTTLVLGLFHDNRVTLAHIGDSRIYLLRGERLQLLTRDDSLLRDQVEMGLIAAADASASHNRNLVTRALGMGRGVNAHLREDDVVPGDVLLLCSDGLNDLVVDADIELILNALYANLPLAAHHLVQAAKDNGGHDNVSVVLAKVLRPFPTTSQLPWYRRWLEWFR
jgi:PPM family protein phosphatase